MAEELQKLEGVVEHLIFENRDSGFAIVEVTSGDESVVVTGTLGEVCIGESIVAYGKMVTNPNYGEQFQAQSCEISMPRDLRDTIAYLSSGALPYIGPATAKKLVKHFGAEVLDIIAEHPERLTEIKGLNQDKAEAIAREFHRMFGVREAVTWLGQYGITPQQAADVFREFGSATVEAVTQNPYLLCGDPLHLQFARADEIAAALSVEPDSRLRIWAGLLYVLRHNAGNGHTCLPRTRLVETTAAFIHVEPENVDRILGGEAESGEVISRTFDEVEYIFLPDLYGAENDIAWRLAALARRPAKTPTNLEGSIKILEHTQGMHYAPLQRRAMELALSSTVMVLTGGPGTGKTTAVNAILALCENERETVALCAPTGRAAKRLSEVTDRPAKTIHRLLEVDYSGGEVRFVHNERNPLKVDTVILDEMSMVDVRLFQSLLCALRPSCRVIMVGDADQLPSVGPGNILGEVLASGVIPSVRLTEIFRQAEKSLIITNAHRIVEGQMPTQGKKTDDFFLMESAGTACQQLVCDLVSSRLPKSYGVDPVRDIQVLCPTKLGASGSAELNRRLQALLNPPSREKAELEVGGRIFRRGDKVMQVKNNYDIPFEREGGESGVGAFNGDMGIVTEVDAKNRCVTVQMDDRTLNYTSEHLTELEPAYAVTIHKSQGSEFPLVVLPAAEVPGKLCYRNLLYTGVTRARKLCVIAGRSRTVQTMVENQRQNLRYSCLAHLLRAEAEG